MGNIILESPTNNEQLEVQEWIDSLNYVLQYEGSRASGAGAAKTSFIFKGTPRLGFMPGPSWKAGSTQKI